MGQNDIEPGRALISTIKRNLLVAKLCVFSIILASIHVTLDAVQGLYDSVIVDLAFVFTILLAYILNRQGHHKTSKIFVLLSLNCLIAFFIGVLPDDVGTHLYYFPLIVASSALFESSEKLLRYFFNALPIALLTTLVLTDFEVFPGLAFENTLHEQVMFAINAFSAAAITIICVNFMQRLNVSSERELKELAEEVHGKNIRLEKTNAELDRFLYSTSHDLRSPLSSIKGLVNIARKETTDARMQSYFNMMIDRVDKLDFFIKDIIDYSKNERMEVRSEPVDFSALVTEVTENLRYIEGAESIHFESHVSIHHPVNADRNRLSVVLNNLMANAIKYHDPGKETQWIDVRVSNSEGTIKLHVADNGMGIDPEQHKKIFDMFYRGTIQSKGSGLGLYIVKETVAKMKGIISVESTPGKGSSFMVTLPAA